MSSRKALLIAMAAWRRGDPAPMDALTSLLQQGYDIGTLEARYRIT